MSLDGKEIVKYGKYGFELSESINPLACMCDDDDSLLIGDYFNRRLLLLHEEKRSPIELQPPPRWATDAVFDGCALYVLDACKRQLFKYEAETVKTHNACVLM